MPTDTFTDSIRYLASIEKFVYCNPDKNNNVIIEFTRAWWDFSIQDGTWRAEARYRDGRMIAAKHITVEYAADILQRSRAFVEVTYRTIGA